ncbi:Clp protease N-terminal domain-containing protein [Streptomyces sp. Tu 2975]|uniref:Clp protease N-terminal domain-containing protein n=1 Tax=Streptomyces sp. Tu 2975 TaxID=2676871 RepID=UPI001FC91BE0|nr:Clp protease N-terminal domain-containing protein [Streptomyces sp. Tu 2975]
MRSPAPWLPRQHPAAPVRADLEAALTVELASVVAGARRRVLRDGDRQIDTAHLLHSLMEQDPGVRAAFGSPAHVARVLGYLVQRSIGYGLAWRGSVEDSGALPVVREGGAPWLPWRDAVAPDTAQAPGGQAGAALPDLPGWSPSAVAALVGALARARKRGDTRAEGIDVLARIAADRDCRAAEVLRRAGIDVSLLAARIAEQVSAGPAA